MAYVPTYTADDIAPMVIDLGLTALGAMIGFGVLIGFIVLYRWVTGKRPIVPGFKK